MISFICRKTKVVKTGSIAGYDDLNQQVLMSLYGHYDLKCHCQPDNPVVMHIRHRQDPELYFIADNPTSPRHYDGCAFYSARERQLCREEEESTVQLLTQFSPYQQSRATERQLSKSNPGHLRPGKSLIEVAFITLSENAYVNYNFGRFVGLRDVINKITGAERNQAITTPWGRKLTDMIYYGDRGVEFAKSALSKLNTPVCGKIPTALCFQLSYDKPNGKTFSLPCGASYSAETIIKPFSGDGPFLVIGSITHEPKRSKTTFREALFIPIVSDKFVFPISTNSQREFCESFFTKLFALNNREKGLTRYIQKPLPLTKADPDAPAIDLLYCVKNRETFAKATTILSDSESQMDYEGVPIFSYDQFLRAERFNAQPA